MQIGFSFITVYYALSTLGLFRKILGHEPEEAVEAEIKVDIESEVKDEVKDEVREEVRDAEKER